MGLLSSALEDIFDDDNVVVVVVLCWEVKIIIIKIKKRYRKIYKIIKKQ